MKRLLSLLIVFALVGAFISCAVSKQKEIDAINEFAASTDTELYSVKYDSASKIIEIIAPLEGMNTILADYLNGDELAVENWNSMKAVMPEAENAILEYLSSLGYSASISLSFADPLSPDVPLLTSQGGQIIYEAIESPTAIVSQSVEQDTSITNNPQSAGPDEAVAALEAYLKDMQNDSCTFTVNYNEATGVIEILNVLTGLSTMLENTSAGENGGTIGWDSSREAVVVNCNAFASVARGIGYSGPVSLTFSDSKAPDKPLLTALNGEIVYDVVE